MQILTFTVAGQHYAIPSRTVLEVLPLVPARPIPLLPAYVTGVFTYRGQFVPLVDLGLRFESEAAATGGRRRLSTRVIVVDFTAPATGDRPVHSGAPAGSARLGLVADDVVAIRSTSGAESQSGVAPIGAAPFLGRLLLLGDETVQMIVVEHLLPPELLAGLTAAAAGAAGP